VRKIILEFVGGSWDGKNLSNDRADPFEARLAVRKYLATENGEIGRTVVMLTERAGEYFCLADDCVGCGRQTYRVTNRLEVGDEVLVRFELQMLPAAPTLDGPAADVRWQ